ncbi:HNH endonuclease [Haliscomenobacter hydrossis]|uniref:Uncharacterized protein n=1 Tax=Haliscomenobacter hydrossis (strain ATCC 27775 / DSM 1100 / LMG 10767 / O) TaxID=760192 RepID=F4KUY0_HALH1|nr:hypothetical protein [Haliscomenobacter hydrossis]AEE48156.1 hypothetical protein Halhy_0244 [Haliscomenobacter hydrossis DSM 1100]
MSKHHSTPTLLSRPDFRNHTFERDQFKCVICGNPALDAHHIIERRLFKASHEKGGYFLDNGASLCEIHHIEAEQTILSCQSIREQAGIKTVLLPEHFYADLDYDKWGNIITSQGRLKGELYYEMSVQETLRNCTFLKYTVHPRVYHLPWSKVEPGDLVLEDDACFEGEEVVVMQKMSGSPFTAYPDYCHGDRIDEPLPIGMREALLQKTAVLDDDMRIYGNHQGGVMSLSEVWVKNDCLDWQETQALADLLELSVPSVLFEGLYDEFKLMDFRPNASMGYVLRLKKGFRAFDVGRSRVSYSC